ncbi:hypothetical protein DCAR_0831885 [Daucus carota subsp. sativus]|uniref:Uncharacterized protein n=1 Tax=Daucus carota subsp. sativus TaxID=79200 RepID=A0AAF1BCU0_DAUCS|nr:hypothetical protein DCAR_0831885 [Daucus carota subsp. sativus]
MCDLIVVSVACCTENNLVDLSLFSVHSCIITPNEPPNQLLLLLSSFNTPISQRRAVL